jgi:hypothetical protein
MMNIYEYQNIRYIDYSIYFSVAEIELLGRLNVTIDTTKKYTDEEHALFEMEMVNYCDECSDVYGNKLPPEKELEKTNISRKKFNELLEKLYSVETLYT